MALEREGAPPLPGRRLSAHSRCRPGGLTSRIFESVCEPAGTHAALTRGQADFAAIR